MNMTENANLIEFLQAIGWTAAPITNLMLVVEGRRSIADGEKRHEEARN